ncbi:O-acetylserine/cysteine efflux transporter [Roseomonas rosea]|uniref:O-acetylserine/cysteine efflux transporter n=1 Tax=Muricoccus roseus TaxID=198092 RepID=A0A1M6FGZ7_9PROT|nr:EamA family transporter [Roseomonas rosea]SHI96936.1 O-acetylserine/cysteine efflux transporter [Roseomonas rosea]
MKPSHLALALLTTALWGFNFVMIRIGLEAGLPPLLMAALRFVVVAIPAFWLPRPRISLGRMLALGAFLFVGQFALLFTGMAAGMPPGLASVTQQSQAFLTALIAALVLRERPSGRAIAGMGIAFAGLALISTTVGTGGVTMAGLLLCLAGAASWAVGNVLLRGAGPPGVGALAFMTWLGMVPILPLFALSLVVEGPAAIGQAMANLNLPGILAILYVAILATSVGYGIWGFLMARYPATTVAPFALLVPITGALSATLVTGESFGPVRLAGMALILVGLCVTAVRWPPRKAAA